ncbi:zf-UBP-domain-containing protein [Coniochaeta ligniaria NRRL 30616]|uniref:Zf-UBP-domain-containing protein n=1 Tax=Coniochaeta ligniaria NRRL 30616 TaxID=1408157 RepID=A0A1J7IVL2_9PEZI|nr:zf-UBP-domain-containing protein [Coniochaeta ligniaria NRRL 30616]
MPSYNYHLKFELYPTADPSVQTRNANPVWVPFEGSSIFDDLPSHPRRHAAPTKTPRTHLPDTAFPRLPDLLNPSSSTYPSTSTPAEETATTEPHWRARKESFPPPTFGAGLKPQTALRDWRFGRLSVESFDMDTTTHNTHKREDGVPAASLGPTFGGPGQSTKGRYVPLETRNTEVGWGIVHLYREGSGAGDGEVVSGEGKGEGSGGVDDGEDGTILCIPAVPSYLSPSDFLGFVGEKWRGDVSHYRMVMTGRMNRYMVLMKFRDRWRAQDWRKEFDGRVFNSMEPEICHVTFIKSITFETPNQPKNSTTPNTGASSSAVVNSLKPFPPPTPNLIELPTCPVCLERMDDTTGLMTILCQHVFHCTCLQTWKGSGCPVCRATNPSLFNPLDPDNPYAQVPPFGQGVSNLCSVCDCADDLWICLICGNVGCGRYKGGHAKEHWKDTAHSFSLELETQHVWDYAGDCWVHRLIRDKGDGKVVELPRDERARGGNRQSGGVEEGDGDGDVVPRAKLDSIGMEYTHLLTSQLESQRVYFEEMVSKAADMAAKAAAAAEAAGSAARQAVGELEVLRAEQRSLREETLPALEKELARERARANKSTELARSLGRSLQEEKEVGRGLMERIGHVNREMEELRKRVEGLREENEELKETNRDLTMFISGQERLRELESEGKVEAGELEEGSVSLPEEKRKKGKGKGKAKK